MHVDHVRPADPGVALVLAVCRRAVADEMLGRSHDVGVAEISLQAGHVSAGISAYQRALVGEALIGASPACILRNGKGRRERPIHAGGTHGARSGCANLPDQGRIVCRTQADIVRKQRGAKHIAVAVHRIRAPDDGNLHGGINGHRSVVITVRQRQPIRHAGVLVAVGPGTAAVEHRADVELLDLGGRDRLDLRLGHLADFLRQSHVRHNVLSARVQRGVQLGVGLDGWPVGVMRRHEGLPG